MFCFFFLFLFLFLFFLFLCVCFSSGLVYLVCCLEMAQGGKAIIKQLCAQHGLKCGPTLIKKVTDEIEEARCSFCFLFHS